MKDEEFIDFFFEFGVEEMKEEAYDNAEKFVCRKYGHKKIHKVDELRSSMFWTKLRKYWKELLTSLLR